jgi:two-component system alkaline phosphatase synthesis response regulator PhoP
MAKILIIDDEESILKMYSDALSGHDVLTSKDGDEGIKIAEENDPDLILLDIILPKVNGLDVLARLKENQETSSIPVLILTNLPKESSADKAKSLGADGYFVKAEYEPEKLAEEVNKLLKEKE